MRKQIKRLLNRFNIYTEKDLVSFGNYLLSNERKEVIHPNEDKCITSHDLFNWKYNNKANEKSK
jgi:hypothetical protein